MERLETPKPYKYIEFGVQRHQNVPNTLVLQRAQGAAMKTAICFHFRFHTLTRKWTNMGTELYLFFYSRAYDPKIKNAKMNVQFRGQLSNFENIVFAMQKPLRGIFLKRNNNIRPFSGGGS